MRFRVLAEDVELVLAQGELHDSTGAQAYGIHDWDNRRIVLSAKTPAHLRLNVLSHEIWHCYRCEMQGPLDIETECNLVAQAVTSILADLARQGGIAALHAFYGDTDVQPSGPELVLQLPRVALPNRLPPMSEDERQHAECVRRTKFSGMSDDQWQLIKADCRRFGVNVADAFIVLDVNEETGEAIPALRPTVTDLARISRDTGQLEMEGTPELCGPDGVWTKVWHKEEPPTHARCLVRRKGYPEPFEGIAEYKMCARYVEVKPGEWKLTAAWAHGAATMLAKCSLAAALRKAFREFLGRIVTREESDPDGRQMPTPSGDGPGLRRAARRANRPSGTWADGPELYDNPARAAALAASDDTLPDSERGLLMVLMDRHDMGKAEAEAYIGAQRAMMPKTLRLGYRAFSAAVMRAAGRKRSDRGCAMV